MKQTLRNPSSTNSSSKNSATISKSSSRITTTTTSKTSSSSRSRSPTHAHRQDDQSPPAATHAARNAYINTAAEVKEKEHRVREKGKSREGSALGKGTMRKEAHRAGESLYGEEARRRYAQREKTSNVIKAECSEAKSDFEVLVNAARKWANKQGQEEGNKRKKEELKGKISHTTVEMPQKKTSFDMARSAKKTSFDAPRSAGILGRSLSKKDKDVKTPTTASAKTPTSAKSAIDKFMHRLHPDPRRDSDASFGCMGITNSQIELAQPILQASAAARALASPDFQRPITPPELKKELFGRKKHERAEMPKPLNIRKVNPVADEQVGRHDSTFSNMTWQTDVSSLYPSSDERGDYRVPPPPPPKDLRTVEERERLAYWDKHRRELRTSNWI